VTCLPTPGAEGCRSAPAPRPSPAAINIRPCDVPWNHRCTTPRCLRQAADTDSGKLRRGWFLQLELFVHLLPAFPKNPNLGMFFIGEAVIKLVAGGPFLKSQKDFMVKVSGSELDPPVPRDPVVHNIEQRGRLIDWEP
jgi:hypothetical protein